MSEILGAQSSTPLALPVTFPAPQTSPASATREDLLDALLSDSLQQASEAFSLDDLLAESLQTVKQDADMKLLRQRTASGNMTKKEAAEANSVLRQWEAAREWKRTHNTITFLRPFCECCGSYYPQFQAFGEWQTHRTSDVRRWVKVSEFKEPDLQREVIYEETTVPMCEDCAAKDGWEVEDDATTEETEPA